MPTANAEIRPNRTVLYDAHLALGAKLVPFGGYQMPLHYALGILKEHQWTRQKAGLFDVSHMGLATLAAGDRSYETVAQALQRLVPADILNLKPGRQRYTQLLNDDGGIIDDLIVTRPPEQADGLDKDQVLLVVNAARKGVDLAHISTRLPSSVTLTPRGDLELLALQGPMAEAVLVHRSPPVGALRFMSATMAQIGSIAGLVSRSGYTGEDGYELCVATDQAEALWQSLLSDDRVRAIGLGARDSLRLEAGLCLYGHDIDETTSPVEAGLSWSIGRQRRIDGDFPGASRIQRELNRGPTRRRVGIRPAGRAPAREGTEILSADDQPIGRITSGGFGPTVGGPIAMGYVAAEHAGLGSELQLVIRGARHPASVVPLPFVPHRYVK